MRSTEVAVAGRLSNGQSTPATRLSRPLYGLGEFFSPPEISKLIKKIRTIGVAIVALLFLASGYYAIQQYINWRETGTSVKSVSWLPDVATNISYTRTNNWRIFEFDIPENEFRIWAQQYDLVEIAEPFYIERYNYCETQGIGGSESELDALPDFDPATVAIINSGLKCREWTANRGGYSVCFDRSTGRAYFHAHDR